MKKIFILVLIINTVISLNAQVEIEWQRCYGGTGTDYAYAIKLTNDGGYIIAGFTMSIDHDVIGSHGSFPGDIWVLKLNNAGAILWQKCLGGSVGQEIAKDILQTQDNGYIVAGFSSANSGDVSGHHGNNDYWIVKIDSVGNLQWQKCLGGSSQDNANSILQTSDKGYIVAGLTYSNDGDVTGLKGNSDYWVVKLDSTGNIMWQKCLGGSGYDEAFSVRQTNDFGYIVGGLTQSNDEDVNGNNGFTDYWVVKLDSNGNIQWQKCYGGSSDEILSSIEITIDNGYILSGRTWSYNSGDVFGNHGAEDYWILKLDSTGIIQWQKCFGSAGNEYAESIMQTIDGHYVIAGYTSWVGGDVTHNNGCLDFWIVKIDSLANIVWQKSFGGTSNDQAYSICHTNNKGFIIAGQTLSCDGDVTNYYGSSDFWVVQILEPNTAGKVFLDLNENGIKDSLEQGVAGHLVRMNPGNQYTYTNNDGYYYFRGDTGVTNTVNYVAQQYWYETTNNYYYYVTLDSLSQVVDTLDYAVKAKINVNDVSVYMTGSPTRANFDTHYWLTYKNWGSITASGTINFEYDSLLTYNSSTHSPASHVGNILVFNYDTLGPGAQRQIRVDFQVPGVQNLGDTLFNNVFITPLVPDTNVINNYDTLYQVITGSYDPNDKKVMPAGYEQWGFVEHGQRLTYTIRFQNTGTDTAFTVVIRDTLDTDLDIETFVVEAYNHPVTWQLHNGNELIFTFQNIMLPDSNVNEPESHGFIRYSISPKSGLADGTTATNTSYIFFDYNPAVITNTTLNTFVTNIPVAKPILEVLRTVVFPNPASDRIYINLPEFSRKVEVYNINGEMVQQLVPQKEVAEINIKDLPKGVYVVKMYSRKGVVTSRFVKE